MANFIASISDTLSAIKADCMDTINNISNVFPTLFAMRNAESKEIFSGLDLQDAVEVPTMIGDEKYVYQIVAEETGTTTGGAPELTYYIKKKADEAANDVKVAVCKVAKLESGLAVTQGVTDDVITQLKGIDFYIDDQLSNMLTSNDVSRIFIDACDAISAGDTTAVTSFLAKYSGPLQSLSPSARSVYSDIVSALAQLSYGTSSAYQYLINVYNSMKSAHSLNRDGYTFLAFANTEYYVEGFFGSYALHQIAGTAITIVASVVSAFVKPIIGLVSLGVTGIGSLTSSLYTALQSNTAQVDASAPNNYYGQGLCKGYDILDGAARGTDPYFATYGALKKASALSGVVTVRFPGLQIYLSASEASRSRIQVRAEMCPRAEIGGRDPFSGVFYTEHIDSTASQGDRLYVQPLLFGATSTSVGEDSVERFDSTKTQWNPFLNACASVNYISSDGSIYNDGTVSDELDVKYRYSILQSCRMMIFMAANRSSTLAAFTTACANVDNWVLCKRGAIRVAVIEAINEKNVAKLANALAAYERISFTDAGVLSTALGDVPEWDLITNYIVPNLQPVLKSAGFTPERVMYDLALHVLDEGDAYHEGIALNSTNAFGFSESICGLERPFITPPKYAKGAFIRGVLLAASVVAATAAISVGVWKMTKAIKFRMQQEQLKVEALRYAYEDNQSDANWAAYRKSLRRYNRLALLTGNSKLSLVNGWEIDSSDNGINTANVIDSVRAISSGDPSDPGSIQSVKELIRGY